MKLEAYRKKLQQDAEYVEIEAELKPLLDLADDVLALRLEKGWSQSELARRAGTKQSNISRLESGLANPTFSFLQKVAHALGTEVEIRLMSQGKRTEEVAFIVLAKEDSEERVAETIGERGKEIIR